jgi:hypothetical protein
VLTLIYSGHAKDVMLKRRITEAEVEQVMESAGIQTPGNTPDRMNLWGSTSAGRKLRITTYRNYPEFIISAVAPEEMA